MSNDQASLHAIIEGRVQGVGFRFFTVQQARNHDVKGRVRNRADGAVEVKARGERSALESFAEALRRGPAMSRVENIDLEWDADVPEYHDFDIGF